MDSQVRFGSSSMSSSQGKPATQLRSRKMLGHWTCGPCFKPFPYFQACEMVGQLFCQPLATWPGLIHFPEGIELDGQPLYNQHLPAVNSLSVQCLFSSFFFPSTTQFHFLKSEPQKRGSWEGTKYPHFGLPYSRVSCVFQIVSWVV